MSQPDWNTGLPKLPEGMHFQIEVIPGGTWVRVFKNWEGTITKSAQCSYKILETYVDAQWHQPQGEYLARVWNAAHHQSRLLMDREERAAWIEAAFDDQDDDD